MERPYNRISANNFDPLSEVEVAVTLIRVLDSGVRSFVFGGTDEDGLPRMFHNVGRDGESNKSHDYSLRSERGSGRKNAQEVK